MLYIFDFRNAATADRTECYMVVQGEIRKKYKRLDQSRVTAWSINHEIRYFQITQSIDAMWSDDDMNGVINRHMQKEAK